MQKGFSRSNDRRRDGRRGSTNRPVGFGHAFVERRHFQGAVEVVFGTLRGQPCHAFPECGRRRAMLMATVFPQNQFFVTLANVVRVGPANHVGVVIFEAAAVVFDGVVVVKVVVVVTRRRRKESEIESVGGPEKSLKYTSYNRSIIHIHIVCTHMLSSSSVHGTSGWYEICCLNRCSSSRRCCRNSMLSPSFQKSCGARTGWYSSTAAVP